MKGIDTNLKLKELILITQPKRFKRVTLTASIIATHTKHYNSVQANKYTTVARSLYNESVRQSMALPSKLIKPLLLSCHVHYTPISVKEFSLLFMEVLY